MNAKTGFSPIVSNEWTCAVLLITCLSQWCTQLWPNGKAKHCGFRNVASPVQFDNAVVEKSSPLPCVIILCIYIAVMINFEEFKVIGEVGWGGKEKIILVGDS